MNVNWTVHYLIQHGMPREKIILGLALYGHGWILSKLSINKPGSKASGPSLPGKIVEESGVLSYFEVSSILRTNTKNFYILMVITNSKR